MCPNIFRDFWIIDSDKDTNGRQVQGRGQKSVASISNQLIILSRICEFEENFYKNYSELTIHIFILTRIIANFHKLSLCVYI